MSTWIKYKLKEKPYYDPRTGEELASIEGRKNRPNIDPFTGGGKDYPASASGALQWHEKDLTLLIQLDIGEAEAFLITEFDARIIENAEAPIWIEKNFPNPFLKKLS